MANTAPPLSIIVESKTSSTGSWDSNKMHPSPLASHPFRIPTPSFTDLDIPSDLQFTSRPMSALNLGGTRTSYLGGDLHDSFRHGHGIRRRRSRDDVAALIEFLRTHEPPPDNFMSQPYRAEDEDEERGRWSKLAVMGKRRSKSVSRPPVPFRLPDSAVAGVTTGGHRHIAISIPFNASHFGDDPKSQYPVSNHNIKSTVPPLPESVRTFKNKKGVVTVLRPLSPSQNHNHLPPSPASPRRFDRDYAPQLLRNRRIMPPSPPPSSPADSEHWPLAQTEPETSSHVQQSTAAYGGTEEARSRVVSRQTAEFVRAAYPSRGSSMAAPPRSKHHHTSSIDEVIAEEPYNRNPSPMPHEVTVRRNTERRSAHPPVSLNTSSVSRKSPSSPRPERPPNKQPAAKQPKVTQVTTDSPVVGRVRSPSPPASINSVKSRREKVREKKLRDIAAARGSKLGTMPSPTAAQGNDPSLASPTKDQSAPITQDESGPKLSNIMIVVDMQPDDEAASKQPAATADDDSNSVIEVPPESVRTLPTPPTSTETSPAQKHGFDGTRTSLTRRREWQSSHEQQQEDRKTHEGGLVPRRPLAPRAVSYGGVAVTDPEREILHLYEGYREQRLRDMESRVRRLERNGDLWLRALMPMLEDVHSNRDWASDDGTTEIAPPRASHRRRPIRRASLSRERMLEELMRREERDRLDHQPDVSGMGSIEPLMRELAAGGARSETGSAPATRTRPAIAPRTVSGDDVPPMPLRPRPLSNRLWV